MPANPLADPLPTILDTLAGAAALRKQETTGGFGHLPEDRLPKGWANITIHRKDRSQIGGDDFTEYYGPILRQTLDFVTIEVGGEPITIPMTGAHVTARTA